MSMRLPKGNMSILVFQNQFDSEDKCRKFLIRLRFWMASYALTTVEKCGQNGTNNLRRCKS